MAKSEWWRHIPHPNYGNWGGRLRTDPDWNDDYSPEPYDAMDEAFMHHDINLRMTKLIEDPYEQIFARKEADKILAHDLRKSSLTPFLYPNRVMGAVYGPAYHFLAKSIFR